MEILGDIAGVEVWDGCWACVGMLVWCVGACKLVVTVTTCTLSHTHTHIHPPTDYCREVWNLRLSQIIPAASQLYLR